MNEDVRGETSEADPALRWKGAAHIEDYNQHIQALLEVQPTLPLEFSFLKAPCASGYVLRIDVEKSQHVHKTADGTVYVRKGAQSLPVKDPQRITELTFAKGVRSYEDITLDDAVAEDVVDAVAIREFLEGFSPQTDPLDLVLNKNLVDRRTFKPRVSGILLFADDPSSLMPKKCSVRIVRYETKEEDPERDHLKSVESIEAPLYSLIHQTVARVAEIMSGINVWTTEGPKAMEYPPETIWEIIVNALIHRDYSISDDVHILIFDNRIEIVSPGRLPAFVTPGNILDVRYARNPRVVGMLSKYVDAPNKDIGEGLNTAFQRMKEWRLRSPEIIEDGNNVRVIVPHASLATPQEAIMGFLEKHDSITNRQARDLTGIKSENAVKAEFYKLRDAGLVEMIPELKGNKAAWREVSKKAN